MIAIIYWFIEGHKYAQVPYHPTTPEKETTLKTNTKYYINNNNSPAFVNKNKDLLCIM